MTLLAMLLSLAPDAFSRNTLAELRQRLWAGLRLRAGRHLPSPTLWLTLCALLPALAVALIAALLPPLPRLLFAVAALYLCLGQPRGGAAPGEDALPQAELGALGRLFIAEHERSFSLLIWFAAAGPGGALFYRLCTEFARRTGAPAGAADLHAAAAWVPLRLTALLCALAGSSDDAFAAWRRLPADLPWPRRGWMLLAAVGAGAVVAEDHGAAVLPPNWAATEAEAQRLLQRALLLLLALCALLQAGYWLS
ncbi:MAG: hypothetical protein KGJ55_08370 [Gammaproteobacteria bacterium]|nr:hypothetical protein [Gammaproteobacteria bacterium]